MNFVAALFVGGLSSRMGRDKALLCLNGEPLWRVQLAKLRFLEPARVLLSSREAQSFDDTDIEIILDPPDNPGPLGALAACLRATSQPLLTLAVDMPLMTSEALKTLLDHHAQTGRGAVFEHDGMYEPLCGLYPQGMLKFAVEALRLGQHRMQNLVQTGIVEGLLDALPLPAGREKSFFNANSPEEWEWIQKHLSM